MKYVQLGNSDLKVSRVCVGCMGFGEAEKGMHSWTLPEEESKEIIKYALDNGINFFDTAMGYQGGTSEEFLGKAMREYAKRQDVVIATKFIPRTMEQIKEGITARQHIETCLNSSLKRLEMDYVDLYILHMWDYNTPVEETMEILHEMIQAGKVKYIGISNCYAWQIAKANEIAKANGWETFISVQNHYNLIFREEEREMASCRLAKHPGEQSKRLIEDRYAKGKYDASYNDDLRIIERVEEIADKKIFP